MRPPRDTFSSRALLGALALVVMGLLAWELRWVLLVLFGAIILAVALDVPTTLVMTRLRLKRPLALLLVLVFLAGLSLGLAQVLLPEVLEQVRQLGQLAPAVAARLVLLSNRIPWLPDLNISMANLENWERLQPLGSQLLGLHPFIDVVGNVGLIVGVLSYRGHLGVGVTVDPDVAGGPAAITQLLADAADELLDAVRTPS